jgi:hypothetical protein
MKEVNPNGIPKILISCEGQQKLMRRKKPRNKQKRDQTIKHLQNKSQTPQKPNKKKIMFQNKRNDKGMTNKGWENTKKKKTSIKHRNAQKWANAKRVVASNSP